MPWDVSVRGQLERERMVEQEKQTLIPPGTLLEFRDLPQTQTNGYPEGGLKAWSVVLAGVYLYSRFWVLAATRTTVLLSQGLLGLSGR